jgi:hypothetical protein
MGAGAERQHCDRGRAGGGRVDWEQKAREGGWVGERRAREGGSPDGDASDGDETTG